MIALSKNQKEVVAKFKEIAKNKEMVIEINDIVDKDGEPVGYFYIDFVPENFNRLYLGDCVGMRFIPRYSITYDFCLLVDENLQKLVENYTKKLLKNGYHYI